MATPSGNSGTTRTVVDTFAERLDYIREVPYAEIPMAFLTAFAACELQSIFLGAKRT